MSTLLVTLKPEQYLTPTHSYGVLAEIDWESKRVIREIRFPTAAFSDSNAFMSPLIGGLCATGNRVFVAMWNYIVEIDYESFSIVNTVSHQYTTDLHGMDTDGQYLYVTATAIDALLCFDINTLDLVWRWGPDEPILYKERVAQEIASVPLRSIPLLGTRLQKRIVQAQKFRDRDYRFRHKKFTGHHHHHLNDVTWYDDHLYIMTKQWNTNQKGAIIKLNVQSRNAEFLVPSDTFDGLHDCVWYDNHCYVTESGANQVGWCDTDGHVVRQPIEPSPYFVRGLCDMGESWLVGMSTLRNTGLPAQLVEYDREFKQMLSSMDVSFFYPKDKGTTIHSIICSPDIS